MPRRKRYVPRHKRPLPKRTPGKFIYYGGMVFEVDNCGRDRPRNDLGPYSGSKKWKHKFYKPGKSCPR